MLSLPPALAPLAALEQFVTWFASPAIDPKTGLVVPDKFNKFPCDWRTGEVINAHDPQYWTSAACALAMHSRWDRGHGSGAGFVFTANDPYFFQDIDGALLPDGSWSPLAIDLCTRLAGAAIEVSHSGRGLHVIGRARPVEHAKKNTPLHLELYTSGRFVALTGYHAVGNADADCSVALEAIVAQYFVPTATGDFEGWTTDPVDAYGGPDDDEDLLARALASGQRSAAVAFGGVVQPTFKDLWEGNAPVLAARWPHDHKPFDASSADQSLANHLAYWTGKNCERMERLMRRSALARDKWDTHRTFLVDTIVKACGFVKNVLEAKDVAAPVVAAVAPEVMAEAAATGGFTMRPVGREYMGPFDQATYFQGCVYVERLNRVWSIPRAQLYDKAAFDVRYGGHLFVIDPANQKTTDSAWDAFTKSRVLAPEIVTGLCFRPEHPPGARLHDGPDVFLNTYVPYTPLTLAGDPTPFLRLVAKMLPDPHDRKILLSYMASLVQNPGVKFQWWPVVQGMTGNGKTLLMRALTYIVGERYTHLPNAAAMAKDGIKFNAWIEGKLFIGVEEIAVSHRRDFLEEFKPIVTNDRIPIEGKGSNQITGDNRANGMLCTNHKDGVPVTVDDRRYAVFYTAQQTSADLMRDNMDGDYFPDLYDWFKGRGEYAHLGVNYGAAVVGHFLQTYELEAAYDPARGSNRAPKTTSSAEAVANSRGRAEQEILEAIEQGRPGFAGGWVSSHWLDVLLVTVKAPIPRTKRREVMTSLGYEYHPNLNNGRVNEAVQPDGCKPVLYVKVGHPAASIERAVEIGRAYTKAQEPRAAGVAPDDGEQSPAALAFLRPNG